MHPFIASFDAAMATGRRLAPRSTLAAAAWLVMLSAGATGALAQQATPSAGATTTATTTAGTGVQAAPSAETGSAPSAPAPLTRAQVIAELECARASGELEAAMLRSYGLPPSMAPEQWPAGGTGCASMPAAPR